MKIPNQFFKTLFSVFLLSTSVTVNSQTVDDQPAVEFKQNIYTCLAKVFIKVHDKNVVMKNMIVGADGTTLGDLSFSWEKIGTLEVKEFSKTSAEEILTGFALETRKRHFEKSKAFGGEYMVQKYCLPEIEVNVTTQRSHLIRRD